MHAEWTRTLQTVLLATLVVAALVALAWWSITGLVLVTLGTLLGLAIGRRLGYRHGADQARQARQARARRRRPSDPAPLRSRSAK